MKTVKIGELKANLSAHLRLVSSGEEVLVCDRDRPVARIVPVLSREFASREDRLIAKGVLSAPTRPAGEPRYIPNPVVPSRPISQTFMDALWEEERADRA
jgi:antitoxin (DNA-binding transcriptional repressor) of toxin-antitoxin stability system